MMARLLSLEKSTERNILLKWATVAEEAERYEDMVQQMKAIVETYSQDELTQEERNLLSVAYKNVVGSRRSSWRIISSLERNMKDKGEREEAQERVKTYRIKIELEIREICNQVIYLVDSHLITEKTDTVARIFYLKMKGDFYRYLAEITSGGDKERNTELSKAAYDEAYSAYDLPSTHPIKLGLALSLSVFQHEIIGNTQEACRLAKTAFEEAVLNLENVKNDDVYKDCKVIMQLLRDNLTLWTTESQNENKT